MFPENKGVSSHAEESFYLDRALDGECLPLATFLCFRARQSERGVRGRESGSRTTHVPPRSRRATELGARQNKRGVRGERKRLVRARLSPYQPTINQPIGRPQPSPTPTRTRHRHLAGRRGCGGGGHAPCHPRPCDGQGGVYADRTSGGDCDHRDSGGYAAAGAEPGAGTRAGNQMREQHAPDGYCNGDVFRHVQ